MNCRDFKDLIVTDYIDGELSAEKLKIVNSHISACRDCREFKDMVVKTVIDPVRGLPKTEVPDIIWKTVHSRITQEIYNPFTQILSSIRIFFTAPKLAALTVSMAAVLLVFVFTLQKNEDVVKPAAEQLQYAEMTVTSEPEINLTQAAEPVEQEYYFTYLYNGTEESSVDGFGTTIEENFM